MKRWKKRRRLLLPRRVLEPPTRPVRYCFYDFKETSVALCKFTRFPVLLCQMVVSWFGNFRTCKVEEQNAVLGYRTILRVDEVWPILNRGQAFHNWHTKMPLAALKTIMFLFSSCLACCCARADTTRSSLVAGSVADSWFVDCSKHIVRRADYKGNKEKHILCLAFDGLTLPGVLFVAARPRTGPVMYNKWEIHHTEACCPLQIRSCSTTQQKTIVEALKMLLSNFCSDEYKLKLLPNVEACRSPSNIEHA